MSFSLDIETNQGEVTITGFQFNDYYRQMYNEGRSYRDSEEWREDYDHWLACKIDCRTSYADSSSYYTGGPEHFYISIRSITITYEAKTSFSVADTTAVLGETFKYPTANGSGHGRYTYTSSHPEVAVVFNDIYNPDENNYDDIYDYRARKKKISGYVLPIAEGTTVITVVNEEDGTASSYTLHVVYQPSTTIGSAETITVEQPGTLRELMNNLESTRIRELTLHGTLNADDLSYLHSQTGRLQNLEAIDMKDVTFEYGGDKPYATITKKVSGFIGNITHDYYLSNENRTESGGEGNMLGGYDGWVKHYTDKLDNLFNGMTTLRRVVWPDCVKGIGEEALAGTGIVSLLFPDDITFIGDNAFSGCSNLCSVNVPPTVTEMGIAFSGCTSIVNVGDLSHMTKLDKSAFAGCKHMIGNVMNMTLDLSGLDTIPEQAFSDCHLLTKIKLSDNLKFIGQAAFKSSVNLSDISLPEGLEIIDYDDDLLNYTSTNYKGAFSSCWSLENVQIPSSLKRMAFTSFECTPYLMNLPFENGVRYAGHVAVAMNSNEIGNGTVAIKEGTRVIADGFSSITIGKDGYEYYSESNFTSAQIPSTLQRIGNYAFGCGSLETINLPEGLEEIGRRAFYLQDGTSKLYGIKLPSTLKSIGYRAFAYCKNLEAITLPEGLEHLGESAFQGCTGLVTVNLLYEKELDRYNYGVFQNCTGLEKVIVGTKVPRILDYMFDGCTNLWKVEFAERPSGDSLAIGTRAFLECTTLQAFKTYSSSNLSPSRFATADEPVLDIPKFVTSLGESAFYKCSSIKSIIVPEGITLLPSSIFHRCSSVERVEMPSTLTQLDSYALHFTDGYVDYPFDLYCAASIPPTIERYTFQSKLKGCNLYVVPEAVEAYQATNGWKDFEIHADETLNIEPMDDSQKSYINERTNFYNLQGQRLNTTQYRGIYIFDGKKYIIH
ncbi:MAG: leucine-rich repeat domain-containing protein [Bacteroidaceae bacterium]|nr:leucine-rich repeat domain-containing protein [Bacteroidaceae bacterium]